MDWCVLQIYLQKLYLLLLPRQSHLYVTKVQPSIRLVKSCLNVPSEMVSSFSSWIHLTQGAALWPIQQRTFISIHKLSVHARKKLPKCISFSLFITHPCNITALMPTAQDIGCSLVLNILFISVLHIWAFQTISSTSRPHFLHSATAGITNSQAQPQIQTAPPQRYSHTNSPWSRSNNSCAHGSVSLRRNHQQVWFCFE